MHDVEQLPNEAGAVFLPFDATSPQGPFRENARMAKLRSKRKKPPTYSNPLTPYYPINRCANPRTIHRTRETSSSGAR